MIANDRMCISVIGGRYLRIVGISPLPTNYLQYEEETKLKQTVSTFMQAKKDGKKLSKSSKNYTDNECALYLKCLQHETYDFIRNNSRFIKIIEELKKHAN